MPHNVAAAARVRTVVKLAASICAAPNASRANMELEVNAVMARAVARTVQPIDAVVPVALKPFGPDDKNIVI